VISLRWREAHKNCVRKKLCSGLLHDVVFINIEPNLIVGLVKKQLLQGLLPVFDEVGLPVFDVISAIVAIVGLPVFDVVVTFALFIYDLISWAFIYTNNVVILHVSLKPLIRTYANLF
jgi:hypothetical protein